MLVRVGPLAWLSLLQFASCVGLLASTVDGKPTGSYPRTNAERFQQGLGPLKPKRFYNPDATRPPLPRRSASGSTTGLIGIFVHPTDSSPTCYVNVNGGSCGTLAQAGSFNTFLSSGPEDVTIVGNGYLALYNGSPFQGPITATNGADLVLLAELVSTGAGAYPQPLGGSAFETTVFTLGAVNNGKAPLSADWVNPQGTNPATTGALTFCLYSGSVFAYATTSPPCTVVYPYFIPNP